MALSWTLFFSCMLLSLSCFLSHTLTHTHSLTHTTHTHTTLTHTHTHTHTQLIDEVFLWIQSNNNNNNDDDKLQSRTIVFLEPSCGHGDVVWPLLQRLQEPNLLVSDYRIVACDVDQNAVWHCQQQHPNTNDNDDDKISWITGDFLELSSSSSSSTIGSWGTLTVCLGGPPYTTGAGSTRMERNLPQQFFDRAVGEWQARLVAFFLPERYATQPLQLPDGWVSKTHALQSSTFFFQGQVPVTQPSILQVCYCSVLENS